MFRIKHITFILAVALALAISVLAVANLSPGTKAPDFKLVGTDGKEITFFKYFEKPGNVVVLDIWATWCPPCRNEVPQLIKLQNEYKNKPVKIVGVAIDDQIKTVKQFAKNNKINYTVLHDPSGINLSKKYKIQGIPATYIISKTGVIKFVHSGFPGDPALQKAEMAKIKKEINSLLK